MTDMMRELCAHELENVSGGDGAVGASLGAAVAGAAAALVQGATKIYYNDVLIQQLSGGCPDGMICT